MTLEVIRFIVNNFSRKSNDRPYHGVHALSSKHKTQNVNLILSSLTIMFFAYYNILLISFFKKDFNSSNIYITFFC